MSKEQITEWAEGLALNVIALGQVSWANAQHPITSAQLRERHNLCLKLFAEEQGINIPSWRIEKYTGDVYGTGEVVPTPDLIKKYEEKALMGSHIAVLLGNEFPVERPVYDSTRV